MEEKQLILSLDYEKRLRKKFGKKVKRLKKYQKTMKIMKRILKFIYRL